MDFLQLSVIFKYILHTLRQGIQPRMVTIFYYFQIHFTKLQIVEELTYVTTFYYFQIHFTERKNWNEKFSVTTFYYFQVHFTIKPDIKPIKDSMLQLSIIFKYILPVCS